MTPEDREKPMTHFAAGPIRRICLSLWLALLPLGSVADADDFYKDRTITFIIGSAPGGGYDTWRPLAVGQPRGGELAKLMAMQDKGRPLYAAGH
jgi:hypothetical protein